jgi:hypothetical protein
MSRHRYVTALVAASLSLAVSAAPVAVSAQGLQVQDAPAQTGPDLTVEGLKSESAATWLAFGGTVVPIALGALMGSFSDAGSEVGGLLIATGIYFGPVAGYAYAGNAGDGFRGTGIRAGIGLATVGLMYAICSGGGCDIFSQNDDAMTAAAIVGLAGVGLMMYSLIHDIAGVDDPVRRHNAEMRSRQEASRLTLAPILSPANQGTVGVAGRLRL